jgi:hypothetical protein
VERSGAGIISCLVAGLDFFEALSVWAKQVPPANTHVSKAKANDRFMSCNLLK